jgi:hypothetical protein
MPALINLRTHAGRKPVRRRAYEAENKAWDSVREPLAAAHEWRQGCRWSHWIGVAAAVTRLHAPLDEARMDRETLAGDAGCHGGRRSPPSGATMRPRRGEWARSNWPGGISLHQSV